MKIVRHHACFDWLISGHQSVNPPREAISILSGKCKRFTFVHPVLTARIKVVSSVIMNNWKTNVIFLMHIECIKIVKC